MGKTFGPLPTLIACLLPLCACTSTYVANVRNETAAPITAQIIHDELGALRLLDSQWIGPNASGSVGPVYRGRHETILFMVGAAATAEDRAKFQLTPGVSAIVVRREGDPGTGTLRVEQVRGP